MNVLHNIACEGNVLTDFFTILRKMHCNAKNKSQKYVSYD